MMEKKHAKEYAELLQEYKEGKRRKSGSKKNEMNEEKDQELKLEIEEILTLIKDKNKGQKEKEEEKPINNSSHSKAQEFFHLRSWKR